MGIPHTRPLSRHGARDAARPRRRPHVVVRHACRSPPALAPCSSCGWASRGTTRVGFAVHVPHYLAQSAFPPASQAALHQRRAGHGARPAIAALEAAADEAMTEIEKQVTGVGRGRRRREGARGAVRLVHAQHRAPEPARGDHADLPSADELGAEFERFLAQQGDDERAGLRPDLYQIVVKACEPTGESVAPSAARWKDAHVAVTYSLDRLARQASSVRAQLGGRFRPVVSAGHPGGA